MMTWRLHLNGNIFLHQRIGLVAQEDSVDLRMRLEPRRHVHRVADDRVVHTIFAAEIADGDVASVDANTKVKRLLCTEPHPFGLQLAQAPQHGDGHAHAGPRILLHALRFGIAEEHHDGITDIFVDGSAVLERDIRGSVT